MNINYSKIFAVQIIWLMLLLQVSIAYAIAEDAPPISEAETIEMPLDETPQDPPSGDTSIDASAPLAEAEVVPIGGEEDGGEVSEASSGTEVFDSALSNTVVEPETLANEGEGFFQTSIFTGSASYAYSIQVPPETNGLGPKLKLTYDSQSASGSAGWVGLGWSLGENYVMRDVNHTPDNVADDEFKLVLNGESHDLVPTPPENPEGNRFHTKIESYLRISKEFVEGHGPPNYWIVKSKDGTTYRFGYPEDADMLQNGRTETWRWYLDLVEDTNGNKIFFEYNQTPGNGEIYLKSIEYNNDRQRRIEFRLEPRPDVRKIMDEGSWIRKTSRLKSIRIFASGQLVKSYILDYRLNEPGTKSLLASITITGSDGSSLPPVLFDYSTRDPGWQQQAEWIPPISLQGRLGYRITDVNRDGRPDLLRGYHGCSGGSSRDAWIHDGSGWIQDSSWNPPTDFVDCCDGQCSGIAILADVNGDGFEDVFNSYSAWLGTGSGWVEDNSWKSPVFPDARIGYRVVDVNGDGLPDIIQAMKRGSGGEDKRAYINTGTGWASDAEWFPPTTFTFCDSGVCESQGVELSDVNGDGLTDIVSESSGAYLNDGNGWIIDNSYQTPTSLFDGYGMRLADVNGDGLPDILQGFNTRFGDVWKYAWLHNGTNWIRNDSWGPPTSFVDFDGSSYWDEGVTIADSSGDGQIDVFGEDMVWLNPSLGQPEPDMLSKITTSNGGKINISYAPSSEFIHEGGDGVSDLSSIMSVVVRVTKDNGLFGLHQQVETTTYEYEDGLFDFEDDEFRGFGKVTVTDSFGNLKVHRFHQDDALKGREYEANVINSSGALFSKVSSIWDFASQDGYFIARLNIVEQYTYDGVGGDPKLNVVDYLYDQYGNVLMERQMGDVSHGFDDRAFYSEYYYDSNRWIVDKPSHTWIDDMGQGGIAKESWFTYDANGKLIRDERRLDGQSNPVTEYSHDSYGNVVWMRDPNGQVTSYSYDSLTRTFPVQIQRPLSHILQYEYDLGTGNLLWDEDPNGYRTSFEYDLFGRKTKEVRPLDSSSSPTLEILYLDDQFPRGVKTMQRESASGGTLDSFSFVDGFGRVIQEKGELEGPEGQVVKNTYYNERGRVAAVSNPIITARTSAYTRLDGGLPSSIQYSYDSLDRVVRVTNPDGTYKSFTYLHWVTNATDENGHVKEYVKDAYGRIVEVREYNGGDVYSTTYDYDAADNLLKITDHEGNDFLFEYDTLGRKTKMVDPDLGEWLYSYDAAGNLVWQRDARGIESQFFYDDLNRLTDAHYPTPSNNIHYFYDQPLKGTLSSVLVEGGLGLDYQYDQRLRKTGETWNTDDGTWMLSWTYDSMDRPTSFTTPRETISYVYNGQGLIESVSGVIPDFDYDQFGSETSRNINWFHAQWREYDPISHRLKILESPGNQLWELGYDSVGNIASLNELIEGLHILYQYDDLDRLTSAVNTGSSPYSRSFTYSPIGNILSATEDDLAINYRYGEGAGPHAVTSLDGCSGSVPPESGTWMVSSQTNCGKSTLGVDDIDILVGNGLTLSGSSLNVDNILHVDGTLSLKETDVGLDSSDDLEYDANGNLVKDGDFSYVFDDANRLVEVYDGGDLVARYSYMPDGIRFLKESYDNSNGVTKTYSIGDSFEVKLPVGGGTEFTTYYRGNGELLARKDNDNSMHYYLNDHLGGTHLVLNANGEIEERTTYYPFGGVLSGGDSRFTYTGQESDKETGLMYYKARYYNPSLRRFTQPDTIIQDYFDPQTLNRYAYVRNNPIKNTDPTGNVYWGGVSKNLPNAVRGVIIANIGLAIAGVSVAVDPISPPVGIAIGGVGAAIFLEGFTEATISSSATGLSLLANENDLRMHQQIDQLSSLRHVLGIAALIRSDLSGNPMEDSFKSAEEMSAWVDKVQSLNIDTGGSLDTISDLLDELDKIPDEKKTETLERISAQVSAVSKRIQEKIDTVEEKPDDKK
ncbi:MAG: RHS repeat-associated core domain-containing protein [Candidatus Altiarchaeota archaeon]